MALLGVARRAVVRRTHGGPLLTVQPLAYLGTVTGRGLPLGSLGPDRILFPIEDETTGITVVGVFRIDRTATEDETSS